MRFQICCWLLVLNATQSVAHADDLAAIGAIEKLGGVVRKIAQDVDDKEAAFHLSGKELTDSGLTHLADVESLIWLNLANTKITDDGLQHIGKISSLKRLHLEKTAIGDDGLMHLKGLANLEYLNLYGTQVSDAGLQHLATLSNLKKIYLWQTNVSEKGVAELASKLANAEINTGADLSPPAPPVMAKAKYLRIRLEGENRILQLAEVQVLGVDGSELQKSAKAWQSSTYTGGDASKAIDGNVEGVFAKGSVSHTETQKNPWLVVDLGETKEIGSIKIYNRGDCCGERLKDAIVEVMDAGLNVVATHVVASAKDGSVSEFVKTK